jgi:hypothetical protein
MDLVNASAELHKFTQPEMEVGDVQWVGRRGSDVANLKAGVFGGGQLDHRGHARAVMRVMTSWEVPGSQMGLGQALRQSIVGSPPAMSG